MTLLAAHEAKLTLARVRRTPALAFQFAELVRRSTYAPGADEYFGNSCIQQHGSCVWTNATPWVGSSAPTTTFAATSSTRTRLPWPRSAAWIELVPH